MALAPIKMDELLVSWLGSDEVYENVLNLIDNYRAAADETKLKQQQPQSLHPDEASSSQQPPGSPKAAAKGADKDTGSTDEPPKDGPTSPRGVIPPFYPLKTLAGKEFKRRRTAPRQHDTWDPLPASDTTLGEAAAAAAAAAALMADSDNPDDETNPEVACVRDQVQAIYADHGQLHGQESFGDFGENSFNNNNNNTLTMDSFVRITKEVCRFPSFFNAPLYQRILDLWNATHPTTTAAAAAPTPADAPDDSSSTSPVDAAELESQAQVVTLEILSWYWQREMEPYDEPERFYRLVKQPENDFIVRDDFLPYIKSLLNDHPVRRVPRSTC
jgi:hypothetical protein